MSEEEGDRDEEAEEAFLQFYVGTPAGPPLNQVLQDPETRRRFGEFTEAVTSPDRQLHVI